MSLMQAMREMRRSELALLVRGSGPYHPPCARTPSIGLSPALRGIQSLPLRTIGRWNTPVAWRFTGALDIECLIQAADDVFCRHSFLRCTLGKRGEDYHYVAEQAAEYDRVILRTSSVGSEAESEARKLLGAAAWRPIDVENEAPVRLITVRVSQADFWIAWVVNHVFADAYSLRIASYELAVLYDAFQRGEPSPLAPLPIQYSDYLASVDAWMRGADAQNCTAYWARYLHGAERRYIDAEPRTDPTCFTLPEDLSHALRELGRRERCAPNLLWTTIHHIALSQLLRHSDITTRSMDVGRRHRNLLGIIGPFATALPIRSQIDSRLTFRQHVGRLRDAHREASNYCLPEALLPIGWLHADFPTLNFVPQEFRPLASLGEPLDVYQLPGLEGRLEEMNDGLERFARVSMGNAFVREGPAVEVRGHSSFMPSLERLARAVATHPDTPLESLSF